MIINTSKLRKQYTIEEMRYLDSEDASAIYKTKANIIKQNKLTGIVDLGCRVGTINKYLDNYEYNYYGFDTSEEPINLAKQLYPSKMFEVRSWDKLMFPNFDVDVLVFGSVLIYSSNPIQMFNRVCNFYSPKFAIVHEVNNKNKEDLNYTDLSYFKNKYACEVIELNLDIPCGKRTIINVKC